MRSKLLFKPVTRFFVKPPYFMAYALHRTKLHYFARYLQGPKWHSGNRIPPSSRSHYHPRYAVANSKQKSSSRSPASRTSPADIEMSDASNAINMTYVSLPRYLTRPAFRPLPTEAISTAAPELGDTPLNYIRNVLSGVKAETVSNVLPKELSVVINDLLADMRTHMLAVYSLQVPAATKRRSSAPTTPKSAGESISIPVVPLCIPAPEVFPTFYLPLHQAHRPSPCNLLPQPAPAALYTEDPTSESVRTQLQQFAAKLAALAPAHILFARAMAVNGL
ncbi:hypothetical protein SCLCIDRAFT_33580 [Scleroderma citrinum Foug A]|uniref:Uncharacterized protein n=1 Tax=Scleroderma citrinum Foug A TaxID=1036808 RepID=A0A0C2YNE5_9AGAM|nr:hypothetical protein SCLCIDRAFT_33580 [Scleroderma citrinum Foug A]